MPVSTQIYIVLAILSIVVLRQYFKIVSLESRRQDKKYAPKHSVFFTPRRRHLGFYYANGRNR